MLVGQILLGYGELELEMSACLASVRGEDLESAIRSIFGSNGAERRIDTVKKEMRPAFVKANLEAIYTETMADMNWCRKLRNQYAHCQWYHTLREGVCFIELETFAKSAATLGRLTDNRHPISEDLLQRQMAYFKYVQRCFWNLRSEYCKLLPNHRFLAVQDIDRPPLMSRPPIHN